MPVPAIAAAAIQSTMTHVLFPGGTCAGLACRNSAMPPATTSPYTASTKPHAATASTTKAAIDDHENGRRAVRMSLIRSSSSNRGAYRAMGNTAALPQREEHKISGVSQDQLGRDLPGEQTIRVVLADDSILIREGTAALLRRLEGVEVVAEAADKDGLLAAVAEHKPDVVITDIRMPPEHQTEGLAAAAVIRAEYPDMGVILLTQFANSQYAREFLSLGASGAGYLLKERIANIAELERSLHEVAGGRLALDPEVAEELLVRKERAAGSPLGTL